MNELYTSHPSHPKTDDLMALANAVSTGARRSKKYAGQDKKTLDAERIGTKDESRKENDKDDPHKESRKLVKFGAGVVAALVTVGTLTHTYTIKEGKATVGEDGNVAAAVCPMAEEQFESLPLMPDDAFNGKECEKDLSGISAQPGTQVPVETTVTPLSRAGDGKLIGIATLNINTGADGLVNK